MTRLRYLLLLAPLALSACKKDVVCPQGEVDCGGRCVSLQTDAGNCGACGFECGDGVVCDAGACVCPPGTESCDGGCFDLRSAPDHCGACAGPGAACGAAEVCSSGACAAACGPGLTDCGRACVDVATDRNHCGGCGVACGAGESCVEGTCRSLQVACFATDEVRATSPDLLFPAPGRAAGSGPIALAVLGDEVFAANSLSHSLSAFPLDPALPGAPEQVLAGSDLEAVAADGGLLLVASSGSGTLLVYDPAAARVVDEIALGPTADVNPRGIALVGSRAYVALYGQDELAGGQAIAVLDLSGAPACAAPDPNPPACGQGGTCAAGRTCRGGRCVLQCGTLASTIDLRSAPGASDAPGLPFPSRALAVDGKVYVTLANLRKATSGPSAGYWVDPAGPSRLAVVDPAAGDALSIVPLQTAAAGPAARDCTDAGALASDGTRLWISCAGPAAPGLMPVDLTTLVPGLLRAVPDIGSPGSLAFCGPMGYVTDLWSGQLLRFDPSGAAQDQVTTVCPTSAGPYGWAWAADVACAP